MFFFFGFPTLLAIENCCRIGKVWIPWWFLGVLIGCHLLNTQYLYMILWLYYGGWHLFQHDWCRSGRRSEVCWDFPIDGGHHQHPALLMRDYGSTYTKDDSMTSTSFSSDLEGQVKSGQKERPMCLLTVQVLGTSRVCEVPMVIQDLHHVCCPL